MEKHSVCHIEYCVSDLKKAQAFYGGLFDTWKFEMWGDDYLMWTAPGDVGGGFAKVDKFTPAIAPLVYILVEEIEPYLPKVKQLGGTVVKEKTEIPQIGWYAEVTDPDGNQFGLFKTLPRQ
jgi:uncharacterized protein